MKNQTEKKKSTDQLIFFISNAYTCMKFQNPSIHGSKDMRGHKSAKMFQSEKGHNLGKYLLHQKLIRLSTQ